jgi:hypothetical protein
VSRIRTSLGGAALAVIVAIAAGSAGAAPGQSPDPPPGAAVQLQQEIDDMRAAGLPADHPKVAMLRREVEALVAGTEATPVPDPGAPEPEAAVQLEDQIAAADDGGRDAGRDVESGAVECEPVPQVLTAAEVASASSCLSVPQPDGTTHYLAVQPSGRAHVVRFGDDGSVERLPDEQLPPD